MSLETDLIHSLNAILSLSASIPDKPKQMERTWKIKFQEMETI
jgi:hypothetical protein